MVKLQKLFPIETFLRHLERIFCRKYQEFALHSQQIVNKKLGLSCVRLSINYDLYQVFFYEDGSIFFLFYLEGVGPKKIWVNRFPFIALN